ncbi:MAG: gamma-glutamylcyclotransferase [Acidobacteriota bacterium]|nr:gamma-glutamylcyclotransferase [Acidobacteriota bacterium]
MNKHLVFVYGTLRRGDARAMSIRFPNSKFIAEAKVSGSLYDLGAYPGLLLNESNSMVIGEVYEVDDGILDKLDYIEASSDYRRRQFEISLGTHRKACWIYEPNPEFYSLLTLISSGDWIEYAKRKTDWTGDTGADETQSGSGSG